MRPQYKTFQSVFSASNENAPLVSCEVQNPTDEANKTDSDFIEPQEVTGAKVLWRGKSGQLYQLLPQIMEKLYFDDKVIVLAHQCNGQEKALWVGNVSDIVCEPGKREIYKRAANEATMAYKIVSPFPASDMAGTIWDVEHGALA